VITRRIACYAAVSPSASGIDRPLRVVIADDECLFRTSLRQLLAVPPTVLESVYAVDVGAGFDVVGEAASGEETVRVVQATHPDLLLLDVCMPRMSGIDVVRELRSVIEPPRTILLTGTLTEQTALTAVRLGVRGLVVKDGAPEFLFEAIASVMAGRCWLDRTVISSLMEATRPLLHAPDSMMRSVRSTQLPRPLP
jgi:DNA-binding NarL/FixJ family response regulator